MKGRSYVAFQPYGPQKTPFGPQGFCGVAVGWACVGGGITAELGGGTLGNVGIEVAGAGVGVTGADAVTLGLGVAVDVQAEASSAATATAAVSETGARGSRHLGVDGTLSIARRTLFIA